MLAANKNDQLMADTKDIAGLSDDEICSLLGEQSSQHVIKQFSPLITAVFHNLESCKKWDTADLAANLDVEDMCEDHSEHILGHV